MTVSLYAAFISSFLFPGRGWCVLNFTDTFERFIRQPVNRLNKNQKIDKAKILNGKKIKLNCYVRKVKSEIIRYIIHRMEVLKFETKHRHR